jgi:hypothetical protein
VAGSVPRRSRQLILAELPHREELIAACAVFMLLAHALLAQVTLVLGLMFIAVTRLSGWRLRWLLVPVAAGLMLTLAAGPGHSVAGYAAGPAHVLGYLGHGHLIDRLRHPLDAFAWAGNWLPAQFPIALIAGAAEAAAIGWRHRRHTDYRAVPTPHPAVIAAIRGAMGVRAIHAGAVVTRDGCALGVVAGTGAIAELRWPQMAGGVLVAGASAQEVTVTGLQVVHAALRRRKPLIVIDTGADAAIARVIETACRATGTPLRLADIDLSLVIGERSAVLVAPGSPESAAKACGDIMMLADDLRRIGVDGDGLVWVPGGERLPAQSLAALVRGCGGAGLAVLISTVSPAAAMELSSLVAALLIHRIADPALAADLAARTDRWLPPAAALAPCPAITARSLLSLGPTEFVLAVRAPGGRFATVGRRVPARLPVEPVEPVEPTTATGPGRRP